jgi:hypothetical protein
VKKIMWNSSRTTPIHYIAKLDKGLDPEAKWNNKIEISLVGMYWSGPMIVIICPAYTLCLKIIL